MEDPSNLQEKKVFLRPRKANESLKVEEIVLKKRNRNREIQYKRAIRIKHLQTKRVQGHSNFKKGFRTPQFIVKRSRLCILDKRRLNGLNRRSVSYKISAKKAESYKVLLVVRNSRRGGYLETHRYLNKLGLKRYFSGIFLPYNEESQSLIKKIEPFVFYGFPTIQTIKDLLLKKAFFKQDGKDKNAVPLCDNTMVEDRLGRFGLLCVEDLVDEIWKHGKNFDEVCKQLKAFELSNLRKAERFNAKKNEYGNLREKINLKIQQIL